jgi:hypothetical protein
MSRDDINQWLANSVYLVRRKPAKPQPARWELATWRGLDGGRVVSTLVNSGTEVRTSHTSCAVVWPELGSFNTSHGYAVHMTRIVERQYFGDGPASPKSRSSALPATAAAHGSSAPQEPALDFREPSRLPAIRLQAMLATDPNQSLRNDCIQCGD